MSAALAVQQDLCASCRLFELCGGDPELIDLVGPHGYVHGFKCVDPAKCGSRGRVSERAHTGRMVGAGVRRGESGLRGRMTASEIADRASGKLRGRSASDYQHLAAARLHATAARQASSASIRAHHQQLAKMHRGIATRTPGRGTGSLRGAARPSGAKGKITKPSRGQPAPAAKQAALRSGETRTPSTGKEQGPNVGELGKASYGSHRLPKGSAALTKEGRAKAFQHGHALPPPSPGSPHGYPVTDARSWDNALKAVGRAGSPERRAQLKALLRRTAAQYGKTAALKKSWAASNTRPGLELAMTLPRYPVSSPYDVLITRAGDGSAIVRHRRGGYEIARIHHKDDGTWIAETDGRPMTPHTHQRAALLEAIGVHNRASGTPHHRPETGARTEAPLQPPPVTTPLMAQYGITNIRALANSVPVRGASDGPRATEAGGDGQTGRGLSPAGQRIYGQLRKRNFPHARAHAFARRAQNRVRGK